MCYQRRSVMCYSSSQTHSKSCTQLLLDGSHYVFYQVSFGAAAESLDVVISNEGNQFRDSHVLQLSPCVVEL